MMSFLALHRIAAQRGEGLRPEFVRVLERWARAAGERNSQAELESGDRSNSLSSPDLSASDSDKVSRAAHSGSSCKEEEPAGHDALISSVTPGAIPA
jgi:hypothetical protein